MLGVKIVLTFWGRGRGSDLEKDRKASECCNVLFLCLDGSSKDEFIL